MLPDCRATKTGNVLYSKFIMKIETEGTASIDERKEPIVIGGDAEVTIQKMKAFPVLYTYVSEIMMSNVERKK